jgi:dihydropteroate synthase
MGVLNVTPDSFSDGGLFACAEAAIEHGVGLSRLGATIVDVGGESTRPGAVEVPLDEELERVRPVVAALAGAGVCVSVDTRHAGVAGACVEAGAAIVNDVSGFQDSAMIEVATRTDAGLVVMHMLGEPRTMQEAPEYDDVVTEVCAYLDARAGALVDAGVRRERIAVDPGIGFGKTLEHNIALLRGLERIAELGYPVVVGASRKRFIGAITGEERPNRRLGGSVAAALYAVRRGASVVRVHDVRETVQALAVWRALEED